MRSAPIPSIFNRKIAKHETGIPARPSSLPGECGAYPDFGTPIVQACALDRPGAAAAGAFAGEDCLAVDLVQLRDRIGPEGSTMARDLVPRLRCSRCGGKNASMIVIPRAHNGGESHRRTLSDSASGVYRPAGYAGSPSKTR